MQILILANHSGGLYDFRKDLILALRAQGRVTAVVPKNDKWEQLSQIVDTLIELPIDRRGLNPLHDFALLRSYRKLLRTQKPDLVLTYTVKPNIYGGLACRMRKIPYAANITGLGSAIENGGMLRRFVLGLYRSALRRAKVVFFENAGNRDTLVDAKIVPAEKTVVLNGAGVNLSDFPYQPYPQENPIRFLFVGRVMREKGIDEFFAAVQRVKAEFGDAVAFSVAGSYEESYRESMQRMEQAGLLTYLGYQSDMPTLYRAAHCVVLPSYHEGMSNVLLEGAASGRALITTDVAGCREAVVDGVSGFLCAPRSAQSLYEAMCRFLHCTEETRRAMGRAARVHMEQNFDKALVVNQTLSGLGLMDGAN